MKFQELIKVLITKYSMFQINRNYSVFIIILLIVHNINRVSLETVTLKPIRNMNIIDVSPEPVFNVIFNGVDNDLIVGARNAIYRLSANDLTKKDEFITGPVNDSIYCLPPPEICEIGKTTVNNDNKILIIKYDNEDYPLLLACGDAYQGMCYAINANNLSDNRPVGPPNDTLSFVGSKSSSFAFFAPYSTGDVLYVAHSYDRRPVELSPPSISSRKLVQLNGLVLTHDSDYMRVKSNSTLEAKYLYGFNYANYSYFLSVQRFETKLIRLCENDNDFFPYLEVQLYCINGLINDTASTAYFGKMGSNMFKALKINNETESHTIFVSFVGKKGAKFNSAICAFSMKQINKAFTEVTKEYFRRGTDNFNDTTDYFNSHVKSIEGLHLNSIKGNVTALAVAIQNSNSVAAIGTEEGIIMKIIIKKSKLDEEPLFEMKLLGQSSDISIRPNPAFDNKKKYLYLLSGNRLIKFPFGPCSLHTDCDSCLGNRFDSYQCGWCGSYCATNDECRNPWCPPEVHEFTPKSGPLVGGTTVTIYGHNLGEPNVSPENRHKKYIKITINGSNCIVFNWDSKKVQCTTGRTEKPNFSPIELLVFDNYGGDDRKYVILGLAKSVDVFKYVEPQLFGVNPSFGPLLGETNVTIYGKNLGVGSKRTILLAGIECIEIYNNDTFVNCVSGSFDANSAEPMPSNDTSVKFIIDDLELVINHNRTLYLNSENSNESILDNKESFAFHSNKWSQYFEYRPNPIITSLAGMSTIKSGTTDIIVNGKYLNSVKNPRMQVIYFFSLEEKIHNETQCKVNEFGSQMICKTPAISNPIPSPKINHPVQTYIHFIMDGVKNLSLNHEMTRLRYFPDPTFYNFSEPENLRIVSLEEPILKIDGKDLTPYYPIKITINNSIPCNLTDSNSFDAIYCVIEYNERNFVIDDNEYVVDIKVGKLNFSIGRIKFVLFDSKQNNANTPNITIYIDNLGQTQDSTTVTIFFVTLVIILFLSAIIVLVMYYLKIRGFIRKIYFPFSIHRSVSDPSNKERHNYLTQNSDNSVTVPLSSVGRVIGDQIYKVPEETIALLEAEHILIDRSNIVLESVIGEGHFGCVYKGVLYNPDIELQREIAVKTLQNSVIRDEMDIESFLEEGLMMKNFTHPHVLTVIGVSFEEDSSPIIVLPYMQNGDLLSYIKNKKNMPTVKNLLNFALDIAKGMEYLSHQKYVHRDLAARNCMLDSDLCAKIADFGLSRDIYEKDYYRSDNKNYKLPIKWMAPESLEKKIYNTKTDVWSYGVLVWELMTRGDTPYPDVGNREISNYLKQGHRLARPTYCPEILYIILLKCWNKDPKSRPKFKELCNKLKAVITQSEDVFKKSKVGLNATYVNHPMSNIHPYDSRADFLQTNKLMLSN